MSTAALLLLLLLLAAAIVFYVLRPLLARAPGQNRASAEPVARAVLRERRRELEASLAHLPPDSPERRAALSEFAAQVSAELPTRPGTDTPEPPSATAPSRATGWAVALAGLLLLPPAGLYFLAGAPELVAPSARSPDESAGVEQMLGQLRERLEREPDKPEGWLLLGRTELAMGRPREARVALERALKLAPADSQTKADLADAIAQEQGASLVGRPIELIREALAGDPVNPKALALAGAFEVTQGNPAGALVHWKKLLTVLPPESPQARQIGDFVANLEAGRAPGAPKADAPVASPATSSGPAAASSPTLTPSPEVTALSGRIELDPTLAARLEPDATLFVVARALDEQGSPAGPPLAVLRAKAADLPLAFTLDDRQAMSPMARLSTLPANGRVTVVARVSRSGEASVRPGDLQGQSEPTRPGATGVTVRINRVAD